MSLKYKTKQIIFMLIILVHTTQTRLIHWGRDEMDNISQTTFSNIFIFNGNVWISIKISLKFVPKGPIYNIPALVQIMAWRRPGDKPLSEPMMDSLPTHICVTRPYLITSVINCCTKNDHEIIMYILSWYPYFALGTGCTGVGIVLKPKLYLYLRDIDTCICSNWLVANTRQNCDYLYIPCYSNWLLK